MFSVSIESNIDIKRAIKEKKEKILIAMNSVLSEMVSYIKQNAPYKDRTGNLRNTTHFVPAMEIRNDIIGMIVAPMEYAIYVEYKEGYWVISGGFVEYKNKIAKLIKDRMK